MSGCWPDLCLSCFFCSSAAGPLVHLRDRMRIPPLPASCSISTFLIHCRGWSTDLNPQVQDCPWPDVGMAAVSHLVRQSYKGLAASRCRLLGLAALARP